MRTINAYTKITLLCAITCISYWACNPTKSVTSKPKVILKLDDLWYKNGQVHEGWIAVMDFLNEQKVTSAIGIIGSSLEKGDDPYFQWIKQRHAEGHEIWHHGYCHCKPTVDGQQVREFRGTSYDYQLAQLQKTQQLAKDKLGLTFTTFGAPYNSTDTSTVEALEKMPELKIWLFKETATPTDKQILKRIKPVNIEYPVHIPDFAQFRLGYESHQKEPILVIQGHPRSWSEDPERMNNFRQIILFLKAEGVEFTTPSKYLGVD
ncbi:MAG: polysaccharide deacetylase family protein [Bacteroidota bacterium]